MQMGLGPQESETRAMAENQIGTPAGDDDLGPLPVSAVHYDEFVPKDNTPPAFQGADPGPGRYLVELPGFPPLVVDAPNRNDAWAKFCDTRKTSPGPKVAGLKITWQGNIGGRAAKTAGVK